MTASVAPAEIVPVDPHDEDALRRLWEIGWAACAEGRPLHLYRPWLSALANWQSPGSSTRSILHAAHVEGRPVGYTELRLPLRDNTHLALVENVVRPDGQRRGHGRALLEHALDQARGAGRSTVVGETLAPVEGSGPGQLFAEACGFTAAQADEMKVADLRATGARWPDQLAETEAAARGYRLVSWVDRVPDEYVAGYCAVAAQFMADIPLGDLDMEPEKWDEQRVRDKEERFRQGGRHEYLTLALAPDGTAVGYTEVMVSVERPDVGFQGATIVLREHRGHRLGLRLKAANHQALIDARPDCGHVITGNDGTNVHMNAVNDLLGFRVFARSLEMQRRL